MSDSTTVEACPECDEAAVRLTDAADPEKRYRCRACGARFPEPVDRPRKPNVGGLSAAGKAALAWSGDDEGGEA